MRGCEAEVVFENIGWLPEWPNGADCKSAGLRLRWFESITTHNDTKLSCMSDAETSSLEEAD